MTEFLARILSPTGFICLATPSEGFHGYTHYRVDTKAKAKWVLDKLDHENKDVYFAIGTLKEREVEVDGKKKVRIAANISQVKSLILDLDVGESKPYKSQAEAIKHLMQFVKEVGLQTPMLVSSGYGVHVYWPMTYAIEARVWQKLAAQFKALTVAYGLHADPSRTADVASILRLPGSRNFKNKADPRRVVVLNKHPVPDNDPKLLIQTIVTASKQFSAVAKPVSVPGPKADTGLGSFSVAQEPADFKDIAKKCQQVGTAVKDQANTKEPVWQLVLQVVRHCHDSEKLSRAVSFKHPGYSADDTAVKMQALADKDIGPAKCDTFDSRNPGGCNGCEHRGKITSPISLGRVIKEATDKPTMVLDHGNGETTSVELPRPPYPYLRTACGGIAIRVKDEDGTEMDPDIIYKYDLHPTKRMYDEIERCEIFFFRSWLPREGWREYPIPAYLIYDERKLMEALSREGVMPNMDNKARLVGYMLGYIQSLQVEMPADQIYSQFGWRKNDTEIVIGNKCYNEHGARQIKVNEQFKNVAPKFESKGDLAVWKKVADIYNREGYEDYAFALMMGFGQLFFKFTGYEGSIFNLYGEGGAGKSTVLKMIHSIYGIPTEKSLLHQDTNNAKLAVIGCYNNLPVTYDEITNIDPMELSDLCYAVSNGRGKEALRQDRTLRANISTWQTTMYCTSNPPLIPKLINLKGTASGETYRMLERYVRALGTHSLTEAREVLAPLDSNYGLAGGVIAEWMVKNIAEAQALIRTTYHEFGERVSAASPERFWIAMCAQAIVGAKIGNMLGLHDYSVEGVTAHAVKIINDTRGGVKAEIKTPVDVLVEYLNSHINDTLVTTLTRSGAVDVTRRPTHSLMILHEQAEGRIYITKTHLKTWCVENNHDCSALLTYLATNNIMLNDNASKSLGDGQVYVTGRSACFLIDAKHKLMSGAAALLAVQDTA
jgi:hypothetical protein